MNKFVFIVLVFISTALMGSSFAIGKIGLAYATPIMLVALRFLLAGVIMAIVVRCLRIPHPKETLDWIKIALIGFFQTAGVFSAMFVSLRTIPAGESSILTFMNPLLVIIFSALALSTKYRLVQWLGVILGFIGVFITLGGQLHFQFGTILGFAGAVSWAIATILVNQWGKGMNTWVLSAYQMLFGGLILFIGSFLLENPSFQMTALSITILLWLAIMASIVQFTIWFFLLRQGNPAKVSSFLFLAPFFGVITGWLLLHEPLGLAIIIGGLFIFAGIFLVNWPKKL